MSQIHVTFSPANTYQNVGEIISAVNLNGKKPVNMPRASIRRPIKQYSCRIAANSQSNHANFFITLQRP